MSNKKQHVGQPNEPTAASVVVIVEDGNKYHSHRAFASASEAIAFADGMEAAWEISHGYMNCWRPLVLDNPDHRQEWEWAGSPGAAEIAGSRMRVNGK